jgi:hypothetical protein
MAWLAAESPSASISSVAATDRLYTSRFGDAAGNVVDPLFAYEALTAFFLTLSIGDYHE